MRKASGLVIRSLERKIEWHVCPLAIRVDEAPEHFGDCLHQWPETLGIAIQQIQPGKPQQNAYVERYNRTLSPNWLDQHMFATIGEVQNHATEWY